MDAIIERYKTECLVEGLSLAEPLDIVSIAYQNLFLLATETLQHLLVYEACFSVGCKALLSSVAAISRCDGNCQA